MTLLAPPEPIETVDAAMDDGAIIRIRRHGNLEGPRIVLSHGNGFAADAYYPFWRELLDRCDVVLFDCRNHGQNPFHTAEAHRYERIVGDLGRIRRAIDDAFGARPALGVFHSLSARANMKHAPGGSRKPWATFSPTCALHCAPCAGNRPSPPGLAPACRHFPRAFKGGGQAGLIGDTGSGDPQRRAVAGRGAHDGEAERDVDSGLEMDGLERYQGLIVMHADHGVVGFAGASVKQSIGWERS